MYDANANKTVSVMNDGHVKHIHTVKFYEGSYSDSEAYNTFFTASTDSSIKLWDLRVGQPVREFCNHINRSMPIGFDVSNCYRYLISGSEDRSVYIYDVGSGQVVCTFFLLIIMILHRLTKLRISSMEIQSQMWL